MTDAAALAADSAERAELTDLRAELLRLGKALDWPALGWSSAATGVWLTKHGGEFTWRWDVARWPAAVLGELLAAARTDGRASPTPPLPGLRRALRAGGAVPAAERGATYGTE